MFPLFKKKRNTGKNKISTDFFDAAKVLREKQLAQPGEDNLLFLDFDGVFTYTHNDERELMKNIMRLVDEFHFKIVISSTWRFDPEKAYQKLEEAGCSAEIIGMTDTVGNERYLEIYSYLMKHPFHNYLILDDMDMKGLRAHAVRTVFLEGFTEKKLKEARALFLTLERELKE